MAEVAKPRAAAGRGKRALPVQRVTIPEAETRPPAKPMAPTGVKSAALAPAKLAKRRAAVAKKMKKFWQARRLQKR